MIQALKLPATLLRFSKYRKRNQRAQIQHFKHKYSIAPFSIKKIPKMKILTLIISLILMCSITGFGQRTVIKESTNCYDLKVKKFDYTVAKQNGVAGTIVSVKVKVKNIGSYNYTADKTATLELYAITGSKINMVDSWELGAIDTSTFEENSWGKIYVPKETLPTQFEAKIVFNSPLTGDCDHSNNSRIMDFR